MSEKEEKIPIRRFKEFEHADAWEQRKLGEIVKSHNAGVYIAKEKYGEGNNIIGVGNIYDSDAIDGEIYRLAPVKDSRFILDENDLIYGESSLVPEGIARTMYVTKKGSGTAFAWHTRRVKINNDKCNSHIITLELNYSKDVRNYLMRASTQTALTGITTESFFGATITYPSLKEQEQISRFFRTLDHLITLHQRKLEKIKSLKKAYLSEMFPAKGECKPKRRFAGYTDAWEQRKLGEVVEFFSGLTYLPENVMTEPGTFVLRSSNVKNGEIVDADNVYVKSAVVNSDNVQEGDIVVVVRNGSRDLIGKHAQIKERMDDTVIGAFMTGVRSDIPDFINAILDTQQFSIEINKNLGATINQITIGTFKKMKFVVPTNKVEQEKVGSLFRQFDDLITLHQRKFEKLQSLKQAYLNEMFV